MTYSEYPIDALIDASLGALDPDGEARDALLERRLRSELAAHTTGITHSSAPRTIDQRGLTTMRRPRVRRRRISRRALLAIVIAVISVSSVALAQPGTVKRLLGVEDARPADRMRVFDEADQIGTRGLSEMMQSMVDGRPFPPSDPIEPAELRAVLTYRRNGLLVRVRSAPSAGGQACLLVEMVGLSGRRSHSGSVSCSLAMRFNGHITAGTSMSLGIGTVVTGLADDDVKKVRIRLSDGRVVNAYMGRNAFLLHLPSTKLRTRGLLVELRDGTVIDVAMNGCLRSQLVPPPRSHLGCGFGMNRGPGDEPAPRKTS